MAVSSGSGEEDYTKTRKILKRVPDIQYICLDVANGYSEHFVSFVRRVRKDFPDHTIMVGLASLLDHMMSCDCHVTVHPGGECGDR